MTITRQHGVLAAAVAATISLLAINRPAEAQFSTGQNGHANDANNQVGSGGYNGARPGSAVTPNDIVNGNVTGLRSFSGYVGERDPRAFTGPVAGGVNDVFVRQSSGVPTGSGAAMTYGQPQPFYGDSRYVPPPAGSLPVGFNGGYIGTTATSPSSLSNGLNSSVSATGLQSRTLDRDTLLLNAMVNPSGYTGLSSAANQNEVFENAAALYGQRTIPTPGVSNLDTSQLPVLPESIALQNDEIFRIRQEMRDAAQGTPAALTPGAKGASQINNPNPNSGETPTGLNQPINAAVGQSFDAPINSAISSSLSNPVGLNPQLSSTGIIPSNLRNPTALIPADKQSALLETLQKRLEQTSDVGKVMAEARGERPAPRVAAKEPAKTNEGAAIPEGPLKVSSLATGIKSKGLRDMLASAEDLMAHGKYDSAVLRFSQAQRVAPNNPLTVLGRAHAELAGGYYARADEDLHLVFRSNPALLLAQFDLGSMLPKDRVDYLENDLKDIAERDPKAERPWFLLAYLAYNTNKPASAEADLGEAEKRAHGNDWLLRLLRQRWSLPSNDHPLQLQPNLPTINSDPTGVTAPTPAKKLELNK